MSYGMKSYPFNFVIGAKDNGQAVATVQKTVAKMRAASAAVTGVGKALTLGVTLPLIGASAVASKFAIDFEHQMRAVGTVIDTSAESLDAMGQEVLRIGRRSPVALDQLTNSLYEIRSAGIPAAQQFRVLEQASRLAVAGQGSVAEATDIVTSSLNAFQLQGEDANRVYDVIFKTAKFGKTTIAGLSVGFGGVAGTIASAGVKLDEYLASVAALTTTGLPASEAHTQLKAVVSGLTRETKESQKVFAALGSKNLPDLIQQSGGLVPALTRIKSELNGDTAQMLKLLGSTEALNAALGLTGAQAGVQKQALADMRQGANALDSAFETQAASAASRIQKAKNNLQISAIQIGNTVLPIVARIADAVSGLAVRFDGLNPAQKKTIVVLVALAATVGPLLVILGSAATAITAISAAWAAFSLRAVAANVAMVASKVALFAWQAALIAFKVVVFGVKAALFALRLAVIATQAVFAAGPIAIVAAVAAIAGAAFLIYKNWGPIGDWFKGLWDGIAGWFAAGWSKVQAVVDKVKSAASFVKQLVSFGDSPATGAKLPTPNKAPAAPGQGANAYIPIPQQSFVSGAPQRSETVVKVDFSNMPQGASASIAKSVGASEVDMGFSGSAW